MKIRRFLGNVLLAKVFGALYGEHLSDVQCGFRAIHRQALNKLKLSQDGMQLTTELLIELRENGVEIFPVNVRQQATERSHLKEAYDFTRHITLMLERFRTFRFSSGHYR